MILKDLVMDLILKTNTLMAKNGQDIVIRKDVVKAINAITGEDSLDTIYINNNDHYNIPDVFVMPIFNKEFNYFVLDANVSDNCPFGYTLEIHQRCFKKYTAEELTAIIIHDIMQNVQSCTAKTRLLNAYDHAIDKFKTADVMNIFDDISLAEILYIAMLDICARPFRVPTIDYDYVGTDEVLKSIGLADAYDSALAKMLPMSNNDPQDVIAKETEMDYRTMKTLLMACKDKTARLYYNMLRDGMPLVTIENILSSSASASSLGFVSRRKNFKKRYDMNQSEGKEMTAMSESFMKPTSEVDLRYQVDKIIMEMKFAESEAERSVILVKIRNLTVKLMKAKKKIDDDIEKHPDDKNLQTKSDYMSSFLAELEVLRTKVMNMEIKEKRYGVFVKYPVNYEY